MRSDEGLLGGLVSGLVLFTGIDRLRGVFLLLVLCEDACMY